LRESPSSHILSTASTATAQPLHPPELLAVVKKCRSTRRALRTIWVNRKARAGLIILAVFLIVAAFAPWLAPYSPTATDFTRNAGPSAAHWLGTTGAGEDAFSQLLYGARISVLVGFGAGGIATVISVLIGLSWGYVGGWVGEV